MATNESQGQAAKERVATYLYFSSVYAVTVGVLYLWGYWSAFGVNILEYLSLADIVKTAAYPIASLLALMAIGMFHGQVFVSDILPTGGGRTSRVANFFAQHWGAIFAVYVTCLYFLAVLAPVRVWLVLPVLIALPVVAFGVAQGFLSEVIPNDRPRALALFALALLPPVGYGWGKLDADLVTSGARYSYLLSAVEGIDVPQGATAEQRVRYVGHAGDFVFLLDPNKGIVAIMKFETGKSLLLGRFPTKVARIIEPSTPAAPASASAPPVAPTSKP